MSDGQASARSTQNSASGPRGAVSDAAVNGVAPVLPALSGVHGASDLEVQDARQCMGLWGQSSVCLVAGG